jgi:hypothetical protein
MWLVKDCLTHPLAAYEYLLESYDDSLIIKPHKETIMRTYVTFFMGKRATLEARTLADASDAAVKLFKVSKSKRGRLAVVLADTPVSTASL